MGLVHIPCRQYMTAAKTTMYMSHIVSATYSGGSMAIHDLVETYACVPTVLAVR